jgi:hypothetical protein
LQLRSKRLKNLKYFVFRRRNVMKLAKIALITTLLILTSVFTMSAQTLRPESDPRNTAPTVGTGGAVGGPTGLFTVYDGQTLRRGEYTFSAAYSNFDRDPGNADFTEVPLSFQVGLSDHVELFFTTDAYRGIKVNSPRNLSGFYLPNSQVRFGAGLVSAPAVVLAPQGSGASAFTNTAIFRPQGAPFAQFPYVGSSAGTFGYPGANPGTIFGFPTGVAQLGAPRAGGNGASLFPGVGSTYGGILPGIVLATTNLPAGSIGGATNTAPTVFSVAPSYLPDAPFLNRTYGETAFSTYSAGAKWRWTGPNNPLGVGVMAYYSWVGDTANNPSGFNQLQRGASAGGNRGDVGAVMFADARVRKWLNISANIGYKYTSQVKGEFPNGTFTLLDRPDEVTAAVGLDFPVNRYFQPILEFRTLQYVGARTPNALENSPTDALAGFRWFPTRWMSVGAAYRYNVNQTDRDSLKDTAFNGSVVIDGRNGGTPTTTSIVSQGIPNGFVTSNDPHGYIAQVTIGRRNSRVGSVDTVKKVADVTDVEVEDSMITLPCPEGTKGDCPDKSTLGVKTTATNPDNDQLLYNYTVSGGRIVGNGSNVSWDLSGAKAGTYTITSAVDNGCGLCGKTVTKTVTVKACDSCKPVCACPTLSVSGPTSVDVNAPMTFTANASGVDKYNWTVSAGTITEGQGTSIIKVDTSGVACGTAVTATAEMSGSDFCADCRTTSSATSDITCPPTPKERTKVNEQGPAANDDIKNSLQNIRDGEMGSDPTAMLYIINTGSAKERAKRNTALNKAIDFLGMDRSRIVIKDNGGSGAINTEYWIVPAGAQPPM